jgi:hypothetical protein
MKVDINQEQTDIDKIDIYKYATLLSDIFDLQDNDICISKLDPKGECEDDYHMISSVSCKTTSNNTLQIDMYLREKSEIKSQHGCQLFTLHKETDDERSLLRIDKRAKKKKKTLDECIIDRWCKLLYLENDGLNIKLPVTNFKAFENRVELILDLMEWSDY